MRKRKHFARLLAVALLAGLISASGCMHGNTSNTSNPNDTSGHGMKRGTSNAGGTPESAGPMK